MAFAFAILKHSKNSKAKRQTDSQILLRVNEIEAHAICALDRFSFDVSVKTSVP